MRAATFKHPLLSVDVDVCDSFCLIVCLSLCPRLFTHFPSADFHVTWLESTLYDLWNCGQKPIKFGTFHVSKFLEETKVASALKFCTRILDVICYKSLQMSASIPNSFQMVPVQNLVVKQNRTTKQILSRTACY